MNVKYTLLILLMLTLSLDSFAQTNWICGNDESSPIQPKSLTCTQSSTVFNATYKHKETFIPRVNSSEDFIKTLHVSFHIWQRANGTGNLDNTQSTKDRLIRVVNWVNQFYANVSSNVSPLSYSTEYLNDSRIRVVLDSIYFYQDNTLDSTFYYCKNDYNHNNKLTNYITTHNSERLNALPLYIVNGYFSSAAGYSHGSQYVNGSVLTFYRTNPDMNTNDIHDYWYAEHLAHEIGHGFDLAHTYDNFNAQNCQINQPDFLWDVYDTTATRPCPTNTGCDVCSIPASSTNNNIMGGYSPTFTSALQMGIIHRSTVIENRWNSGYNMRNYITAYNTSPLQITQNETWDFSIKMYQDLVVKSGTTLTIQCEVQFVPEAKVIIEPGGKLIIDGGKLTNEKYYNNFWQGIQVYGTTNKNQFPESNPTYQGLLVIKNGGIIENAHKAVTNWHQDNWNEIGGVIQATNAIFRNNRRDVEFMSYQNYNTNYTNKYRNLSKFTNTDFVTTNDFIEKGLAIQTHVTMWQVDGITFTNCHFSNDITTNKNNSSAPNRGIYSIDAGYSVLAGCSTTPPLGQQCPTANLLKSSFKGFNSAIEATGAATTQTITIQQSNFIDNVWGITIDEFDNVSLNRNTMDVGDADYTLFWPIGAGIMVNNSTGYKIEENTVSTNLAGGFRVGINVSNSGTDDNRVYKNSLQALNNGVAGNGVNHNSNYQKGLQFLCNNFQNNTTAIAINSSPTNDGVRFYQGNFSPLKSAGNTFTNNTTGINNTANSIVYIHNGGNTQPVNNSGMVSLQSTTNTNSCPTSFGGGIIMKPILLVLDSLNTELGGQTASYNNLNFTYTSLIDNGNTEQFKDNIELNWSDDAWKLRGKLLASSPYLSSEVLLKAAKQNVLPNGMLLEILLANPDATKGEKFISQLKTVTNNTFPEYMLDYVRGNFDSRTLRTDMEGQLSSIHSELSNTRSWIKYLTKSKEEYTDTDRLNAVNLGDDIYSKVGVMDYYIAQGAFNKADSVLNTINNDKKYTTDLPLIENFSDYINFRKNLGNRNLAQLDSTEVAYLQILANGKSRVAGYAQNILCFFYDICYEKELATGNAQNKAMMIPSANSQEALNNVLYTVTLYPNPAKEYTSIQWEIYDELNNLHYNIVDLNGREQLSGILFDNKGEQVIDTRKLKQGIYIIGIYNNNQLKVSKKLVVENQK